LTDLLLSPGFVGFLTNSCFSFADTIQGGSGIGKEIGYTFAESGAKGVLFADINATAAAEAAEESKALSQLAGFKAISVELDVTNAASVQKAVDLAVEEFGAIDYCINSAGVHSGLLQHVESSTNQ
jgi:NAD(P)-dependent dehydrogenase (short-subunit alcohol dehydrogenase family)